MGSEETTPDRGHGGRCKVCGELLAGRAVVTCRKCQAPHHQDCWHSNRGCTTHGCDSRTYEETTSAVASGRDFSFTLPLNAIQFTRIILAGFVIVLGGSASIVKEAFKWLLPYVLPFTVIPMLAAVGALFAGGWRHTFCSGTKTVRREFVILGQYSLWRIEKWLFADEVVEVHLQRYERGITDLYVALADGSRRLLFSSKAFSARYVVRHDLCELAEKVAAFCDTTVRCVEGRGAPSREEILDLAHKRQLAEVAAPPRLEAKDSKQPSD